MYHGICGANEMLMILKKLLKQKKKVQMDFIQMSVLFHFMEWGTQLSLLIDTNIFPQSSACDGITI